MKNEDFRKGQVVRYHNPDQETFKARVVSLTPFDIELEDTKTRDRWILDRRLLNLQGFTLIKQARI